MVLNADSLPYKLAAAAVAIGLLALGVPQIGAAVLRLYAGAVAVPTSGSRVAYIDAISGKIALLKLADRWFGDPEARIEAGVDELAVAQARGSEGKPDHASLDAAVADLAGGLSRAPADPFAWLALGDARMEEGEEKAAAAALRASILFGSHELALALPRSELGLSLWPSLDSDEKRAVASQIRLAWDRDPYALVRLVRLRKQIFPVMIALAQNPDQLTTFMRAFSAPH